MASLTNDQILQLSSATGYSPDLLTGVRDSVQQQAISSNQPDASGDIGQYQDALRLGYISPDTTFDQFIRQVEAAKDGGGDSNRLGQFMQAEQYVSQNTDLSEAELERNMRQQFDLLNAGEITSVIDARPSEDLSNQMLNLGSYYQEQNFERGEARDEMVRATKSDLNYGANESLPDTVENAIDAAVNELYGESEWWRFWN